MIEWIKKNVPYFYEQIENLKDEITVSVGIPKVYKTLLIVFGAEENEEFLNGMLKEIKQEVLLQEEFK
jgi:hypothetical protein